MQIVFRNNKIRKRVEGIAVSNKIANRRLTQLVNATCFTTIPASAKPHFLKGDLKNFFAVDFDYPARLKCEPIGDFKKDENGQFVKESIVALEIVEIIKDYHSK